MNLLNRKILTIVLVGVAIWLGRDLWLVFGEHSMVQGQLADVQAKVRRLQQDNQQLASSSAYFKSDAYLEKQARTKLNYKLPDEQVTFIYPNKSSKSEPASPPTAGWHLPDWKSWLGKFKASYLRQIYRRYDKF